MQILPILIGGAISFFSMVGKDWLMEKKKDKEKNRQFRREKLEEIYIISKRMNDFASTSIDYKIDTKYADPTKLQLNIHLYFMNELCDEFDCFMLDYQKAIREKSNHNFQQFDSSSFEILMRKIVKISNDIQN